MTQFIAEYARARTQRILLAFLGLTPVLITACSNPSSAPASAAAPAGSYSAAAFFSTQPLGDTDKTPEPACYPVSYLEQQLGLTATQDTAIQSLQDSLRLAMQAQLNAMKAAGTLNRDSVRALRLQFQTALMNGLGTILTASQMAQLKALLPPSGLPIPWGKGPRPFRRREGQHQDSLSALSAASRDSLQLVRMEQTLAAAGDTLTASQIALIQNLQATLAADTTLTPEAREAQFGAQIQTILTPAQLAVLQAAAPRGGGEGHRRRR